jgi:hypothetical protein
MTHGSSQCSYPKRRAGWLQLHALQKCMGSCLKGTAPWSTVAAYLHTVNEKRFKYLKTEWMSLTLRQTVSRPLCLGIKDRSRAYDQIFITVRHLRVCWYAVLSLTRGRVCRLQLLLALAKAFILGVESRGTRDHILLSQIWDFSFRRLLQLPGLRWRYSTPPPHGIKDWSSSELYLITQFVLQVNTLRLHYKDEPVNAVQRNRLCLLWETYETHKCTAWTECRILVCFKAGVTYSDHWASKG